MWSHLQHLLLDVQVIPEVVQKNRQYTGSGLAPPNHSWGMSPFWRDCRAQTVPGTGAIQLLKDFTVLWSWSMLVGRNALSHYNDSGIWKILRWFNTKTGEFISWVSYKLFWSSSQRVITWGNKSCSELLAEKARGLLLQGSWFLGRKANTAEEHIYRS